MIDPLGGRASRRRCCIAEAKTNEISVRKFPYGDTDAAFAQADTRVALTVDFPRLSFTPMECYVVVAEYNPADDSYDVHGEFPGAVLHPSGDGAGAARAGAEDAAAHPAGLRRQLRHQALGVSLCRADRDRRARSPAGR